MRRCRLRKRRRKTGLLHSSHAVHLGHVQVVKDRIVRAFLIEEQKIIKKVGTACIIHCIYRMPRWCCSHRLA